MRHLLCARCGAREQLGRYTLPAGADGPAESYRVKRGAALPPTPETRRMTVTTNGRSETSILPLEHYDCDRCGAPIGPGSEAVTLTVWIPSRQPEPYEWEPAYITEEP